MSSTAVSPDQVDFKDIDLTDSRPFADRVPH